MKKKTLKEAASKHYGDIRLSPEQMEELQETLGELGEGTDGETINGFPRGLYVGLALAVVICCIWIWLPNSATLDHSEAIQKVYLEVAKQHAKNEPPKVFASTISELSGKLEEFPLIQSIALEKGDFQLVGGRFCSLLGETAIQMRYKKEEADRQYLVYQLPAPKPFDGWEQFHKETAHINGIQISIWVEAPNMFVVADAKPF